MDQELHDELDALKSNVCQVEGKLLNEWLGKIFKDHLNAKKQQAATNAKHGHESVKNLEDRIVDLRDGLANLDQDALEKNKVISSLEKELSILTIQTNQLANKKVLQEKQLDEAKKHNTQEEQVVKKAREKTVLKMNQFSKGIKFFQEYLGFTFKKVNDDHLQFVFKYIDPKDHEAPFVFTVKIDESGRYDIKDCSPTIGQLSSLTDELNKTNDFSKFVVGIRKGFKELVG